MMITPKSFVCAFILLAAPFLSHGSFQADSLYPVLTGCDTAVNRESTIEKQILAEISRNGEHENHDISRLFSGTPIFNVRHVMGKRQLYLLVTYTSWCKPCKDQLLHEAACLAMEWGKSAY